MLRLAGLRLRPLARIGLGVLLVLTGYGLWMPALMVVGGALAVTGSVGSSAPNDSGATGS
jgi:hypothetical protein